MPPSPICTRRLTIWWPRRTSRAREPWELPGILLTGKRFRISAICIYRLVEGKVAENWEQADMLGLMQQLGVLPAHGSAR